MNLAKTLLILKKISENLNDLPITIEDYFLLQCIYERTNSSEDKELQQNINWYFTSFKMYDVEGNNPILIKWTKRVEYLISRGLLEAPYGAWWSVDKYGFKEMDFSKLEVTEKFTKGCLVNKEKKESLWELFIDEFGEFYYLDGKELPQRIPSKEIRERGLKNEQDMMDRFWKICDNGNTLAIKKLFDVLYKYKETDMNYTLGRFLLDYNSICKILKIK